MCFSASSQRVRRSASLSLAPDIARARHQGSSVKVRTRLQTSLSHCRSGPSMLILLESCIASTSPKARSTSWATLDPRRSTVRRTRQRASFPCAQFVMGHMSPFAGMAIQQRRRERKHSQGPAYSYPATAATKVRGKRVTRR